MSRWYIGIGAGGVLVLFVGGGLFAFLTTHPSTATAQEISSLCMSEPDHERCYEREVPNLYPALPLPKIFDIVRDIRRRDPSYQFCHVLAHKLGENAVAADPSHWLDLIPLNPSDGMCSNGFIHGVIVGRFRNDVLDDATLQKTVKDFQSACEPRANWHPSSLDQAICYHGMGHLFMFITNADIKKSIDVCGVVGKSPTGNFLRVCSEGVFMQIYQPLEPDDFALLNLLPEKPTAENYRRLCSAYTDPAVQGACLREAWPLAREGVTSGTGVAKFCSKQPNAEQESDCYDTATAIIGRMHLADPDGAATACTALPQSRQSVCFISVAQAQIEEDREKGADALAFCSRAPGDIASQCVQTLVERSSSYFPPDSPDQDAFCALASAEYHTPCTTNR